MDASLLMQIGHALNMIAELPEWVAHWGEVSEQPTGAVEPSALAKHPLHAMRESFVGNVRLMTEFLTTNRERRTLLATHLFEDQAPPWPPPTGEAWWWSVLASARKLGNKQFAHVDIVERSTTPVRELGYTEMASFRSAVFEGTEDLLNTLRTAEHPDTAEILAELLAGARSRATWPIPPWEPPSDGG